MQVLQKLDNIATLLHRIAQPSAGGGGGAPMRNPGQGTGGGAGAPLRSGFSYAPTEGRGGGGSYIDLPCGHRTPGRIEGPTSLACPECGQAFTLSPGAAGNAAR